MAREIVAAAVDDLADGDMRELEVDGRKILLSRLGGRFYAIGGECSHYGGPLAEGVRVGECVTCPWHQARFHLKTGDLLSPPALDAMNRFEVMIKNGQVMVILPEGAAGSRTPRLATYDPRADGRTIVILGAGAAGIAASQRLRMAGFRGRLILVTQEAHLPYDRPTLSKGYLRGDVEMAALPLRPAGFYQEADIEVWRERRVVQADATTKTITFQNGDTLAYDALLVATGGAPKKLTLPGADLRGVFTLRSLDDAQVISASAARSSRAVVVGAGFIGLEAAACLRQRGLAVTVVSPAAVPLKRQLGEDIGRMWQDIHEEHGVEFRLGRQVARFAGLGELQAVVLDDGEELAADLVIVGIGVRPATDFLTGVPLNPDGSLTVDEFLCAAPGLYAAGDVARYPDWLSGEPARIEHWQVAQLQGWCAADNLAGQPTPFRGVPFFWTEQFDAYLLYVGYAPNWEEIIWHGRAKDREFVAFYVHHGRVAAAAGMGYDYGLAYIAEALRAGRLPSPAALREGETDFLWHLER
jgi:NADPH-dependent 2,4-dienoyl-CoA reductase/sulfur reductase-like enzyme/nitrite reductase/ring-hydroxylating ferredoxin subunit